MSLKLKAAARLLAAEYKGGISVGDFVKVDPQVHGRSYGRVREIKGDQLVVLLADSKSNLRFGFGVVATMPSAQCIRINVTDIPS
jgi:hypothetical protein